MILKCFFFNDTATTEIYTLSLHDALPISSTPSRVAGLSRTSGCSRASSMTSGSPDATANLQNERSRSVNGSRSEEHTSELQSRQYLVCRLLLENKTTFPLVSAILSHSCSP